MQQVVLALLALAALPAGLEAQQAALTVNTTNSNAASSPSQQQMSAASLQAHLNAIQAQAHRQLGQLNGLVLNAVNGSTKYSNVFEAMANVGKAIQQQLSAASNPNNVNIITAPASSSGLGESANNKKNEYQSIVVNDQSGPFVVPQEQQQQQLFGNQSRQLSAANYREQGEILRQDIMKRAGQLQVVVASSMDLLKNNGDQIVRRLLEHMNVRLDQAKAKADRIINEPATNEVALKALATINSGLNHLNTIISNIVSRLDQASKENQYQLGAAGSAMISQRNQQSASPGQLPQLLDTNKFRTNLHQLGQQFQQVLNSSQLHQQLSALRQRQQQQMALLPGQREQQPASQGAASNKLNADFTTRH